MWSFMGKCDSPANRASRQRLVPRALLPLKGLGNQAVDSKMLPGDKEGTSLSEKTDGAKVIEKTGLGTSQKARNCNLLGVHDFWVER